MANTLQIIIDALNLASPELKKLSKDLQDSEKAAEKLGKAYQTVGLALTGMAAAGSVALFSATKLAARVETLGIVVDTVGKNAGYSAGEMRRFEHEIRAQGITLQATRQSLAMMGQAQIDFTKGAELARIAQNAAVIANEDSSASFQKLTYVIQTGNILMARRMGLALDFQGALAEEAARLGKTTQELTSRERVQARTNAVVAAGAQIEGVYDAAMTTAGKKMLSLNRHVEESRRIIGEAFLPILADTVDVATEVLQTFEDLDAGTQRQAATMLGMATAWTGLAGTGLLLIGSLSQIAVNFKLLGIAANTALGPIGILLGIVAGITTWHAGHQGKIKATIEAEEELRDAWFAGDRAAGEYKRALDELDSSLSDFDKVSRALMDMGWQLTSTGYYMDEFGNLVAITREELFELYNEFLRNREVLESSDAAMLAYANNARRIPVALGEMRDSAGEARESIESLTGPGILGALATFRNKCIWAAGGGRAIEEAFEDLKSDATITDADAKRITEQLIVQTYATLYEIGEMNWKEAWRGLAEEADIAAQRARELIRAALSGVIPFNINIQPRPTTTGRPRGTGRPGRAFGGTFTVPPGYPGDSYMVGLSSGERVSVATQGQAPNVDLSELRDWMEQLDHTMRRLPEKMARSTASMMARVSG